MNGFSIALFLHIVGALGVVVALSLEWASLRQIRSALLPEQVRPWMGFLKSTNKVGFPSMLTTVVTGIYMVLSGVGWVPWILVVIGALVLIIVLSVALTKPRMVAIGQALATEKGPLSPTFHHLVNHPIPWISIQTRIALALGIIFLKIAEPALGGSLLTIGLAIVLGVVSALLILRPVGAHEVTAN
jgi:hypothetical protein